MKNCRGVEPRRGASRRNLGTRARHTYETHFTHKKSAIAALCNNSLPSKVFPHPNTGYPAAVCAAMRSSQRETISSVES